MLPNYIYKTMVSEQNAKPITIILYGQSIQLSYEDFIEVARNLYNQAQNGKRVKYYVIFQGKRLPARCFVYKVLELKGYDSILDLRKITSQDAIRILTHFGIKVKVDENKNKKSIRNKHKGSKKKILNFAGVLSIGGNALEDEEKLYAP